MKTTKHISFLICLIIMASCIPGFAKEKSIWANVSKKDVNSSAESANTINDTIHSLKKPTYQEIYTTDYKWSEIIGKLKYDPSTKIEIYNYKLIDVGLDVKIELYHINNRIITVEKRTFDKNNVQLTLEAFEFTENNDCVTNTQWNDEEKMAYIYAMHWGSLIKYDVNCKLMELKPAQKQKIIQSLKVSLESIMQHFPGYKYSFNWI